MAEFKIQLTMEHNLFLCSFFLILSIVFAQKDEFDSPITDPFPFLSGNFSTQAPILKCAGVLANNAEGWNDVTNLKNSSEIIVRDLKFAIEIISVLGTFVVHIFDICSKFSLF